VDLSRTVAIESDVEFDRWLAQHGSVERDVVVAIYNKASGKQAVGLVALQEAALCHGWVDTQTQGIDAERYAIRFVPRRADSSWSPKNRAMAERMLEQGRVTPAGARALPRDLSRR
jgi:uncharacterized protein YdeI (YjbR/CyaY-like superfamily)